MGTALRLDLNQNFKKAPITHYATVTGGSHPRGQGHRGKALGELSSLPGGEGFCPGPVLGKDGAPQFEYTPFQTPDPSGGRSFIGEKAVVIKPGPIREGILEERPGRLV